MTLDNQGRMSLGKELCEEFDYKLGMKCRFVYEGNKTFRLVPVEDLVASDMRVSQVQIDAKKHRIIVPKEIRSTFGSKVLVYGKKDDGYLYLEFQDNTSEQFYEIMNKLSLILAKLS